MAKTFEVGKRIRIISTICLYRGGILIVIKINPIST